MCHRTRVCLASWGYVSRWIWLFVLLGLSGSVFADSSNTVSPLFTNYTTPATDLSMHYLGSLFGNVSNILHGDGSDLLGKLFLVLNKGILVVASLWLVYTTANLAIGSAVDGSFTSPQRKGYFIMLRLAAGFALILPNSSTGYSPIQDIVMKVTVEGVRLADDAWAYALQYLQNGGFVYDEAGSNAITSQMPSIIKNFTGSDSAVNTILSDEICMDLSNAYAKKQAGTSDVVTNSYNMVKVISADSANVYFPGYGDSYNASPGSAHACGSVTSNKTLKDVGANGLLNMVGVLKPIASTIASNVSKSENDPTSGYGADISADVLSYVQKAQQAVMTTGKASSDFFADAVNRGWLSAGGFYWDIAHYNDSKQSNSDPGVTAPVVAASSLSSPPSTLSLWQAQAQALATTVLSSAKTTLQEYASTNGMGQSGVGTATDHTTYSIVCAGEGMCYPVATGTANTFADDDSYDGGAGVDAISDAIPDSIATIASDIFSYESSPTGSNQAEFYNPISFVMHLGADCLAAAGSVWTSGAQTIFGMAIVAGICTAVSPGATILQALMSWLTPLYMGTALAFFVAGVMLCFYAPLYPYLLFLFGVVSWLIYVVEAMVAAPLVCFGLTHPEGHDFLGKAEQAVMLMLGVFLRPVLMVIGFLVSMVMSYICFAMVNYGFSHVLRSVFNGFVTPDGTPLSTDPNKNVSVLNSIFAVIANDSTGKDGQTYKFSGHYVTDLLLLPILFVLYGVVVIEVVNQCFSLVHVLPDQVLRWIGGPVQQDRTEQMVQKVGQQVQGVSRELGQVGGSATLAQGQAAGAAISSGVGVGIEVAKLAGGGGGGG